MTRNLGVSTEAVTLEDNFVECVLNLARKKEVGLGLRGSS